MTLEQRSDSAAAGHEACDQPIRSLEILNQCVPLFETLKDPNRQQLLVQLVCHGPQTVGELAESSALSRTAVSHHIKLLEEEFGIEELGEAEATSITTVGDLVRFLQGKVD